MKPRLADWKRKITICRECPYLRQATMQCKLCGCFVDAKAATRAPCPDKRWQMHLMLTGMWRVDSLNRYFAGNIIDLAEDAPLATIQFDQIARFDMFLPCTQKRECCLCCDGQGVYYADISKPCIVLKGGRNPCGLPYRLLDGRHRLWAMEAKGMNKAKFKILELAQIKPYLKYYHDRNS